MGKASEEPHNLAKHQGLCVDLTLFLHLLPISVQMQHVLIIPCHGVQGAHCQQSQQRLEAQGEGKGLFAALQGVSRESDGTEAAVSLQQSQPLSAGCVSACQAHLSTVAAGGAKHLDEAWPTVHTLQHRVRESLFYPRKHSQLSNSILHSGKGGQLKAGKSLGCWCMKPWEYAVRGRHWAAQGSRGRPPQGACISTGNAT